MNQLLLTRIAAALLLIGFGGTIYAYMARTQAQEARIALLATDAEQVAQENVALLEQLEEAKQAGDALARELSAERAKTGAIEKDLGTIRKSVDTLEKLQYTDPELLNKYSKVYFLSENYAPSDLARVPSEFSFPSDRTHEMHARVIPYLIDMFEEAAEDGIDLRAASAYRSFGTQTALKSNYLVTYGAGANRFSADQGYSEHQLGTTLDITTPELGSSFTAIEQTEAFEWLTKNAHKYGFVLSYPKDNAYYQYEPWHWRFVGTRLAEDLHDDGRYLYELYQREIDEYLVYLFD